MPVQFRHYDRARDYQRVHEFLVAHHRPGNLDGNWLAPAWEYMHGHPALDESALQKIGLWETDGALVAVAHYESRLGEAFFQFHPEYTHLRADMLAYAEADLYGVKQDGTRYLNAYVNDYDRPFGDLVRARGYTRDKAGARPLSRFELAQLSPPPLPQGFRLTSLADECDWAKVHRVLWRGFDHGDDIPMDEAELESRRLMFDTPAARRDLKVAVQAPDGEFVAFCGMFYEPVNRYGYVEPVATDPRYRRMGLGRAAVLEGIRRCGALGATVAYVGSDLAFYLAIGFQPIYTSVCWVKELVHPTPDAAP